MADQNINVGLGGEPVPALLHAAAVVKIVRVAFQQIQGAVDAVVVKRIGLQNAEFDFGQTHPPVGTGGSEAPQQNGSGHALGEAVLIVFGLLLV